MTLSTAIAACSVRAPESPFESAASAGIESLGTGAGAADGSGTGQSGPDDGAANGDGTGGIKLDVGNAEGGGDEGPVSGGCKKADFLFVIDNSGSMGDEQDNLIASFDGFIGAIQQTVQAQDYHVMVVDTDASGGGGQSSSVMCSNGNCTATCQPAPACCEELCDQGEADICNTFECGNLPDDPCSGEIGAGKIYRADGTQCLPPPTPRFMTEADPNLADTFGCVGHVGTYGSGDEHPMEAMGLAVGPLDAPGECNEGFLRDDAILVVTFITDEEDIDKSPGGPTDWAQAIIDAKGGNKDAIVVLGLFGDNDQAGSICEPYSNGGDGAEPGVRLRQFTELFGARGFAGSVCADDYSSFFAEAVDIVDLACNEFEPAG